MYLVLPVVGSALGNMARVIVEHKDMWTLGMVTIEYPALPSP